VIVSLGANGLTLLHLRGTAGMLFGLARRKRLAKHPYRLWAPTAYYHGFLLRQVFAQLELRSNGLELSLRNRRFQRRSFLCLEWISEGWSKELTKCQNPAKM